MAWGRTDKPLDPADKDQLSIRPYAMGLAEFVSRAETPMTIGLQGEWGSGKTSVMQLVKQRLVAENSDTVQTLWFDAWQYGAMGNAQLVGLSMLRDLSSELVEMLEDKNFGYKWTRSIKRFMAAAVPATLSTLSHGMVDGDKFVESSQGDKHEDLRDQFAELVGHALDSKGLDAEGSRLVVFIDDLDRIEPKLAVRLLEVLKNFMDVDRCVFVVACDYQVVREGVRALMNITDEDDDKVDAFFHKLFQVPFHMPVGAYTIDQMLKEYLEARLTAANDKAVTKSVRGGASALEAFVSGTSKDISPEAKRWSIDLIRVVQSAIGTNPRAFKRYLNLIDLTCCIDNAFGAEGASTGDGPKEAMAHWKIGNRAEMSKTIRWVVTLFPIVALQQRWSEVAPHLLSNAAFMPKLEVKGFDNSRLGGSPFTKFEQRLRTLTERWPKEVQEDAEYRDSVARCENFYRQVCTIYEVPHLDVEAVPPALQDLVSFCDAWFTLLDNGAEQDVLMPEELEFVTQWSERLGKMGTSKVVDTKWNRFSMACEEENAIHGDGFVSLASTAVRICSPSTSEYLRQGTTDGAVRVGIHLDKGKKILALMQFSKDLSIKVNATWRNELKKWRIAGLAEVGQTFHRALSEIGVKQHDFPAVDDDKASWTIKYLPRSDSQRDVPFRQALEDFLEQIEGIVEAHERNPTSHDSRPVEPPAPTYESAG